MTDSLCLSAFALSIRLRVLFTLTGSANESVESFDFGGFG